MEPILIVLLPIIMDLIVDCIEKRNPSEPELLKAFRDPPLGAIVRAERKYRLAENIGPLEWMRQRGEVTKAVRAQLRAMPDEDAKVMFAEAHDIVTARLQAA